jgi:hypothetical protein
MSLEALITDRIARNKKQIGAILRRRCKQAGLTKGALGVISICAKPRSHASNPENPPPAAHLDGRPFRTSGWTEISQIFRRTKLLM